MLFTAGRLFVIVVLLTTRRIFVIAMLLAAMAHGCLSVVVLLRLMAAMGTVPASWTIADLRDTVAGNDSVKIILAYFFNVKVVDEVVIVIIVLGLVTAQDAADNGSSLGCNLGGGL